MSDIMNQDKLNQILAKISQLIVNNGINPDVLQISITISLEEFERLRNNFNSTPINPFLAFVGKNNNNFISVGLQPFLLPKGDSSIE